MSRRILVTGSTGFTGRYVSAELQRRGYGVFGLTKDLSVTGQSIDLRDRNSVLEIIKKVRPNGVIHLAAIANVEHKSACDFFDVNVNGTNFLLDALTNVDNVESIIIASSANIYGNALGGVPLSENLSPNPQNLYAESKVRMEEMIRNKYAGFPITIVRPFNYTGVGQSTSYLIPKIVSNFRSRSPILFLGNLNVSRDFSDVRFVAWAYVELINRCAKNELLNICSGRVFSIGDIIEKCYQITKYKPKIQSRGDLKRNNEVLQLCGDPTHMLEVLGSASPYSFEATLQWMLSNK